MEAKIKMKQIDAALLQKMLITLFTKNFKERAILALLFYARLTKKRKISNSTLQK